MIRYISFFLLVVSNYSILFSQDIRLQKQKLLDEKQYQLLLLENKETQIRNDHGKVKEFLVRFEKQYRDKKFDLENKKAIYEKASSNVELVTAEKIKELFTEYKIADKEFNKILENRNYLNNKDREYNEKLEQLNKEKLQIKNDILNIKADIFDFQIYEPVWAIGEAICNLAENETPDECRKRALESAQRDAMEKGGKMILESETIVKNYQLYLDEIRTQIHAQIIDQDISPQYGVRRVIKGDNITYIAKVRSKVQYIGTYNPYRKQKNILQSKHDEDLTNKNDKYNNNYKKETKAIKRRNFSITFPGSPTTFPKSDFFYIGLHHSNKPDNDGYLSEGGGLELTTEANKTGIGFKWKVINMDFYKNKKYDNWCPFIYSNIGLKAQLLYFSSFCTLGWGFFAWDTALSNNEPSFEYYGLFHWNYGLECLLKINYKCGLKIGYDVLNFFANTENKRIIKDNKISQITFGLLIYVY